MTHKYSLGENVLFVSRMPGKLIPPGAYEIVRQLPSTGAGEPQYRIKSAREMHERVVTESQLEVVSADGRP